jgi:hypothetical protein
LRAARGIPGYERAAAAIEIWDQVCAELPRRGLQSAWEERELVAHEDQVLCLAVGADGKRLLSGGMDQALRVWDLATGAAPGALAGHQGPVSAVALAGDGWRAASGSWDGKVRLWDPGAGRLLQTLEGHEAYVTGVDFSPDGSTLASGGFDQNLRLWDLGRKREARVLGGHLSNVTSVAFGGDGKVVASGSWDGTVRIWDASLGECICVLQGHEGNVNVVALSPTGREVASGGQDGKVRLWDPRTRRPARVLPADGAEVTSLAYTPDAHYLVAGCRDGKVRLYDLRAGACVRTLSFPAAVLCLGFTPMANTLLCGGADAKIRLWHLDWEPEGRPAQDLGTRARPFVQSFVSLHFKPGTVRAAGQVFGEGDVDALVTDLRRRGFGALGREAVERELHAAALVGHDRYWNEVRQNAPRGAVHAAQPRDPATTRLRRRQWLIAGGVLCAVALSLTFWLHTRPVLRISPHVAKTIRGNVDLIDLSAFGSGCDAAGYDGYLDQLQGPEPGAPVLGCLAALGSAATVDDYLVRAPLADPADGMRNLRLSRNAVSVMVGLGEPAAEPLCRRLGDSRPEVREIAATALALTPAPGGLACLKRAVADQDPAIREEATSVLRYPIARGNLRPEEAFDLVRRLAHDPDPRVRVAAIRTYWLFTAAMARQALEDPLKDSDPTVVRAAQDALAALKGAESMDLGR